MVSLPTLYSHLFAVSLIICKNDVNKCELRCQLIKAITFQGYRLYWSFEFQKIQKKNEVGNIDILVLWRDREKFYRESKKPHICKTLCQPFNLMLKFPVKRTFFLPLNSMNAIKNWNFLNIFPNCFERKNFIGHLLWKSIQMARNTTGDTSGLGIFPCAWIYYFAN